MVTGGPAATTCAAAGGGARREHDTAREKEGGEAGMKRMLTLEATVWTVRSGNAGRRRELALRRRPEAEKTGTEASVLSIPVSIP